MDIRNYLIEAGNTLTKRPLPNFQSEHELLTWRKERIKPFHRMLGIDVYLRQARTPLNIQITGTLKRDGYQIKKICFESLPGLYVVGNYYVPDGVDKPVPAILYLCGHNPLQKVNYQDHPRKFAQMGFAALVIDTIELGESHSLHRGTQREGRFDWYSKGYSPAAVEVWNGIRAIDFLAEQPEVDKDRIGVTGHSGGGVMSWWIGCADERVATIAVSSGTGTVASHIKDRTLDLHCDCCFPNNPYGWSLLEMCALMAPRPVFIVAPDRDLYFHIDGVKSFHQRLKDFYGQVNKAELVQLLDFRFYHGYSEVSRKGIFSWFFRHLANPELSSEQVGDVDSHLENEEDLLVFNGEVPANDRSTSVQDWFIPDFTEPVISSLEKFQTYKKQLLEVLKKECFNAFESASCQDQKVKAEVDQRTFDKNGDWIHRFSFSSEKSWRLQGSLKGKLRGDLSYGPPAPVVVKIQKDTQDNARVLQGIRPDWLIADMEVRGTGNTAWGKHLDTHVRRALALLGKTLPCMQIWDVLCGLEAVRSFSEVDPQRIYLAASGDMAAVVIYAALLDGNIAGVILDEPPASHKGWGHQVEMINLLRYTDLPISAALLWPMHIIFNGRYPENFQWTEEVYLKLGQPGGIWRNLSDYPG